MSSIGETIIFEIGSSNCRVGFAGHINPEIIFPTVIAIPNFHNDLPILVGNDTIDDPRKVHYFFMNGIEQGGRVTIHKIRNEPIIKYIIEYAYDKLDVNPRKHPVLIPDFTPYEPDYFWVNRQYLSKIFFEEFEVPYLYFGHQCNFALLYANIDTGIVLDCGHDQTSCISIYDGYPIMKNVKCYGHAGKSITEYIQRKVNAELGNDDFSSRKKFKLFDDFKKNECYVSLNYEYEKRNYDHSKDKSFYDHSTIDIGDEQFECAEILFNPIFGNLPKGIPQIIYDLINESYSEIQKELAENIYLTGGTAQMKNFVTRIQNELDNMGSHLQFKVQMVPDPELASWRGASKFGMIKNFTEMAISKEEYNLKHNDIIYKKSF